MIKSKLNRYLCILMCAAVLFTSLPASVFAYEDEYEENAAENDDAGEWGFFDEEEYACEDPFTGYMLKEAEAIVNDTDQAEEEASAVSSERGGVSLSGHELYCYEYLKEEIKKVAGGERSITEIYIPLSADLKDGFDATELGVAEAVSGEKLTTEAKNAMYVKLKLDFMKVVRCLMLDMPYELYWFDKVSGYSYKRIADYRYDAQSGKVFYIAPADSYIPCWRFSFIVSKDYRKNAEDKYSVDSSLALAARAAAAKAAGDVMDTALCVSSDYAKLNAYRTLIQGYSEYNHAANNNKSTPYGDPWQMIYVFDEDSSTKVVCEGFSKAFKFMCDLSSFAGDIECYLVSGYMGSASGAHMWNNVRMEDGNIYLVDVTNSRSGDGRFMAGAVYDPSQKLNITTSSDGSYMTYAYSVEGTLYYYDKLTLSNNPDSDLVYSTSAYDRSLQRENARLTLDMNYEGGGRKTLAGYKDEDVCDKILAVEPVREGYVFGGWYDMSEGGNRLSADDSVSLNDCSRIFYAHWSALPSYSVSVNACGGSFTDGTGVRYMTLYEGDPYYKKTETPYIDEHHMFTGWYSDDSISADSLIPDDACVGAASAKALYAGWFTKKYKLTLYANGGVFYDGVTGGKVISYKALTRLSDTSVVKYTPSREGYVFTGYHTAKEGGSIYDIAQPITGNVTLYAHWEEAEPEEKEETGQEDKPSVSDDTVPDEPAETEKGLNVSFYDENLYADVSGIYHAVYSGKDIEPSMVASENGIRLTEGRDYTLKYLNNKESTAKSGTTASVKINWKGSYTGTTELRFVIDQADMADAEIGNLCVKEGNEGKAEPVIAYKGMNLKKNKDYGFTAEDGNLEILGIGNFKGKAVRKLTVLASKEYKKQKIKVRQLRKSFVYDGKEKTLVSGNDILVSDKEGKAADVAISYSDNVNAGKVTVVICGINGNYGCVKKSFRIKAYAGKGTFNAEYDKKAVYSKKGAVPGEISLSCRATKQELKEGRDYKLTYVKNRKSGNASVKIRFTGNYKGSSMEELQYEVVKADISKAEVYASRTKKNKLKVLTVLDGELVPSKELKITADQTAKTLEVKALDKNYTGSIKSVSLNSTDAGIDISKAKVVFTADAKKQKYKSGEAVTLIPGKDFKIKLSAKNIIDNESEILDNFDICYADNETVGKATLILRPKTGKYRGLLSATFRIIAAKVK